MPLNPRKHSVAELVSKLDDLSVSEIKELEEAEIAGRGRKSLLAAITEALDAHAGLEDKLEEIAESVPKEAPLNGVGVLKDRRGWFAAGGPEDFSDLRYGSEAACRAALALRVSS